MNMLVVYDAEGYILYQASGDGVREPVGVPTLWVEVPQGKHVVRVDVSGEVPTAVLEDIPKSAEQQQIEGLKQRQAAADAAIAELTILLTTPQI